MISILLVGLGVNKPSTRLRILPLADYLRHRGHAVSLLDVPRSPIGRVGLLRTAARHDVVVLQKKLFPAAFVKLLRMANPRLIFDVDDAVMFHELERGQPVTGRYFLRFAAVAAASHIVVAGNAYVAELAAAARGKDRGEVAVLPTPIDTSRLSAKPVYPERRDVIIGWIGTKGNLHQLPPLADALREVASVVPGVRLRLVADGSINLPGIPVEMKPWHAQEEMADLHGFDIGIMPLEDTLWNRGKGGYKLLQYMAAGLPAVASPVGINADIVRRGENGFLASTPEEWQGCLLSLAQDSALRQRLGRAARTTVEGQYSLDLYLERYTSLIEDCLA